MASFPIPEVAPRPGIRQSGRALGVTGPLWTFAAIMLCGCAGSDATTPGPPPPIHTKSNSNCSEVSFAITTSISNRIGTVGVVEWSASASIEAAWIDFGRDPEQYEFRAPVATLSPTGNRTVLLGMKAATTYSFAINVEHEGEVCTSAVQEVTTGPLRNGLPRVVVDTTRPEEAYGGFTIVCQYLPSTSSAGTLGESGWAFIFDTDGDIVWWYRSDATRGCARARLSYDGQHLWMGNTNVGGRSRGTLARVRLDGTEEEQFALPRRHHDFVVMPDETITYIEYAADGTLDGDGCDLVRQLDPATGRRTLVYSVAAANPTWRGECHSNAINWWPEAELFTVSVLNWNAIIAFGQDGALAWVLGGERGDFVGARWERQHQHHLIGDHMLLFNNSGGDGTSRALEYELREGTAELVFSYDGGAFSQTFGGTQRLPNGNTLVSFSNAGVLHEVNPAGELVQEIATGGASYVVRRRRLYGPPPPYEK